MNDIIMLITGAALGIAGTLLVMIVLARCCNSPEQPTPTDDYADMEYDRWRIQKQAEAEINRMRKNLYVAI